MISPRPETDTAAASIESNQASPSAAGDVLPLSSRVSALMVFRLVAALAVLPLVLLQGPASGPRA